MIQFVVLRSWAIRSSRCPGFLSVGRHGAVRLPSGREYLLLPHELSITDQREINIVLLCTLNCADFPRKRILSPSFKICVKFVLTPVMTSPCASIVSFSGRLIAESCRRKQKRGDRYCAIVPQTTANKLYLL